MTLDRTAGFDAGDFYRARKVFSLSESNDLPRVRASNIEPPPRKVSDLQVGEQAIVMEPWNFRVDEKRRIWMDADSKLPSVPRVRGQSFNAERIKEGFILWLDDEAKFRPRAVSFVHKMPVVEIRYLPEETE